MTGREDFKTLVAEVSMGRVGAVFALEVSRLARSNLDWHRLLELCALTDTLVIDEDGCYNPADFNDGLFLGLKGTMAQAELHLLRVDIRKYLDRTSYLNPAHSVGQTGVRDIEVVFCRFFFLWQKAERCNTLGGGGRTCLTLCLTLKIAAPPF